LRCAACDGHNREGSRFCRYCGATVNLRCTRCSTVLEDDSKFCDNCGDPVPTLASGAKTEPAPEPVWVIEAESESDAGSDASPEVDADVITETVEPEAPSTEEPKPPPRKPRLKAVRPSDGNGEAVQTSSEEVSAPWSPENLASRVAEKVRQRLLEHDLDAFVAAQSPDVRVEDRRPSLVWDGTGRDAALKRAGEYTAKDVHLSTTRLATWGSRLGLDKHVLTRGTKGRNASESLVLYEVDEHGYIVYTAFYGPDDLVDAMRAMSERYVAGEGRSCAEVLESQRLMDIAYGNRDWKAFAKLLDTDVTFVDHRPSGVGTISGRPAVVAYSRDLVESSSDERFVTTEILATEPDRTLTRVRFTGIVDPSPVQMEMLNLAVWRKGRLHRLEHFAVAQLEEALARFGMACDEKSPVLAELERDTASL
jgi:hypothetical protein